MEPVTASCPLCRSRRRKPLPFTSFVRCRDCGAVANEAYRPLAYSDAYFTEDYRAQYGRTYEEDFDAIYASSRSRLAFLFDRFPRPDRSRLRLLDIGCALGFFLQAARDAGVGALEGIEISPYAASIARGRLGCTVHERPFGPGAVSGRFDIITAWYFIEHCPDPRTTVEAIYDLLAPGGLFAFASPSAFGPLFRFDRARWIETHPVDHRVDFTPHAARRLLAQTGFRAPHTRPGAIHPERIMSPDAFGYRPIRFCYAAFSRLASFSDTLEVYAQKPPVSRPVA